MSPERTQSSPEEQATAEPQTVETPEVADTDPNQTITGIEQGTRERDALDDIIDESKATSHLVRALRLN